MQLCVRAQMHHHVSLLPDVELYMLQSLLSSDVLYGHHQCLKVVRALMAPGRSIFVNALK